jgi:phospholipase C
MRFIAGILMLSGSLTGAFAYGQNIPTFQHIVIVIQENRTPDNLFGSNTTFEPGVDLQQPASGQWCLGACFDPDHSHTGWEGMWGKGNGWNNGQGVCNNSYTNTCGLPPGDPSPATYCNDQIVNRELYVPSCPQETYVSSSYDGPVVSPYFDIASKYGFANYFFQTNEGPSMPAHEFLFTGTSAPTGSFG